MKKLFIGIIVPAVLFFCSGCGNNNQKEITDTVNTFYKNYKGNFRETDPSIISKDLQDKIKKAIDFEKQSALQIKNSAFPTDKPQLIEGDILSGLYEGFTTFNISETKQKDGSSMATATIDFFNKDYDKKWQQEIVLINEAGWKIDNVIYLTESKHNKNLKNLLEEFIKLPLQ